MICVHRLCTGYVASIPIGGVWRLCICESHGSSGRVTAAGW